MGAQASSDSCITCSPLKTQEILGKGEHKECNRWRMGKSVVNWCLVNMTSSLCFWTHSSWPTPDQNSQNSRMMWQDSEGLLASKRSHWQSTTTRGERIFWGFGHWQAVRDPVGGPIPTYKWVALIWFSGLLKRKTDRQKEKKMKKRKEGRELWRGCDGVWS